MCDKNKKHKQPDRTFECFRVQKIYSLTYLGYIEFVDRRFWDFKVAKRPVGTEKQLYVLLKTYYVRSSHRIKEKGESQKAALNLYFKWCQRPDRTFHNLRASWAFLKYNKFPDGSTSCANIWSGRQIPQICCCCIKHHYILRLNPICVNYAKVSRINRKRYAPEEPFSKFRASKSVEWRILCCSGKKDGF